MLIIKKLTLQIISEQETYNYKFNFSLPSQTLNCLVGKTGIGKTSMLLAIAGLIKTDQEDVIFENRPLHNLKPAQRPISFVFQENNLLQQLDVKTNIQLGLSKKITAQTAYKIKLAEYLESFKLSKLILSPASQLSGGQKQLVAITRLLLRSEFYKYTNFKTQLLLLDEPLTGLDDELKKIAIDHLMQVAIDHDHTLLLSTHELKGLADYQPHTLKIVAHHSNIFSIKSVN